MTPGAFSLPIYRGDSYSWQFVLWADPAKTIPMPTTGAATLAQIRNAPGGQLFVTMPTSVAPPNLVNMQLLATDSATLNPGSWAWDLQVVYATGAVQTVLAGAVVVTEDVSHL
jgi:hypothetical protein